MYIPARHQWLMPVILATQKAEIRRITVQIQPGQIARSYLEKPFTNIGLMEWYKVKALGSNSGITHTKKYIPMS
jgi:hypothetical protein